MKTFFRGMAVVFIIVAVITAITLLRTVYSDNLALTLFAGLSSLVLGLALFKLADLMESVSFLQEKLNLYAPESDEELPQKTCPDCGQNHDFDCPKCPHCGKTETERG